MHLINTSIHTFYTSRQEETRLSTGLGPLELERNKILISRYLTPGSAIADIGGGPGHYAKWLAELGHHVTLIDPVPKHIDQAARRSGKSARPFRTILGEARRLPFADNSQDLVILHGPLYHLPEEPDRKAALDEARRVLKKGGVALGFAITHSASVVAALQSNLIHHHEIFNMCKEELLYGNHHPPRGFQDMLLPRSFFHRPSGLIREFASAGFETLELSAVEGIAWLDGRFFESWSDPVKRERLLQLIDLTGKDPELLCFSPHIMLAARSIS